MSETFQCDDKGTLVAYLYGEIDADGRREVERHLRSCAACAEETQGLQTVRRDLECWMPPDAELGFTIVPKPATVVRPSRWAAATLPVWAQVAAAALVIGVGAAIANVQVRYGSDGLSVSTGWLSPAAGTTPTTASTQAPTPAQVSDRPADDWKPALVALEQQLRSEMSEMRRTGSPEPVRAAAPVSADSAAILRRVQTMVEQSEERQRQEVGSRMMILNREFEARRQADLYNIRQTFGTLNSRTFKTAADQQELASLVRRVRSQPIP